MMLWVAVCRQVDALNHLYGNFHRSQGYGTHTLSEVVSPAQQSILASITQGCQTLCGERRGLALSGAQAARTLLKSTAAEIYGLPGKRVNQVTFISASVVEPPTGSPTVNMLDALPPSESQFYALECNVLEPCGIAQCLLDELTNQYGFLGGPQSQWVDYLLRRDYPSDMWEFCTRKEVKARAGISTVPKKDPSQLRKLVMACPANALWKDPRDRMNFGLGGAAALNGLSTWEQDLDVSLCDESNAFTTVVTPRWMWNYFACPPVRARDVWHRLRPEFQARVTRDEEIFPMYTRLPMGSSHSVHILMSINMQAAIRAIHTAYRLPLPVGDPSLTLPVNAEVKPTEHVPSPSPISSCPVFRKGPHLFYERAKRAKSGLNPVLVVLHCFAGPRRQGDLQDWLIHWAEQTNQLAVIESVDLAWDADWDLADANVISVLVQMAREHLIDMIGGGAPCATWSRVRFLGGGPRPLRFRGQWSWGRPDLTPAEALQVKLANLLMINFMGLCEEVHAVGGAFFMEHPEDPGLDPYPSIFATETFPAFQGRTGCRLDVLDQCMYGGPAKKGTGLAHTLEALTGGMLRCDGRHNHGPSSGKNSQGVFHSRRLQTYPSAMNSLLAWAMTFTSLRWSQLGRPKGGTSRSTKLPLLEWKSLRPGEMACQCMNEKFVKGEPTIVTPSRPAFYLHVDDGAAMASPGATPSSDDIMLLVAEALEAIGFIVPDRIRSLDLVKVLGFCLRRKPLRLVLPAGKASLLRETLLWLADAPSVDTSLLSSTVGVWIWAASLNRAQLAVPSAIFKFIDMFFPRRVAWWESARKEIRLMAALVPALVHHLALPTEPLLFASDAEGPNQDDFGGYGIVATDIDTPLLRHCFEVGWRTGSTIAKLDGSIKQVQNPLKEMAARIPVSKIPKSLVEPSKRWGALWRGRWKTSRHITLGEGEATNILLQHLIDRPQAHGHRFLSLCDNMPWCAACTKGRSPTFRLNLLLRRRAAMLIAANIQLQHPWMDTARMPADSLSRLH